MLQSVITTIQRPTDSVIRLAESMAGSGAGLVIAGDTKGPDSFDLSSVDGFESDQLSFLSIDGQLASGFALADLLPTKHYCRKNIGYLHAMRLGATCIYETDDDNAPLDHWTAREEWIDALRFAEGRREDGLSNAATWINVYKYFSNELIWPRGLPLDQIRESSVATSVCPSTLAKSSGDSAKHWAPIQQGLANGAPDVDAIWRLVLDRDFDFDDAPSVMLAPGQWCPFNTQTTWWWPAVYPLLYVPSYCPFRMCDIWKSFVAQRCLWELGTGVVFHPSEVVQERNPHNLMSDFKDEVPGYQQNHQIAEALARIELDPGVESVGGNLRRCYATLVDEQIFPENEMQLVDAWLADLKTLA
ncbi:hypothetical protein Mal15_35480 [Stieleria maiorica]|uniref:DUF288 domain-containing protein n=1 Tax=Stieleria maiorica TaxID=2795974 RepID=A0A5B9MF76_9BACT|nr:STELLO glycosyltransferase family protein [Stieleria maiorica]QEF99483.1 hypothetical protein Mal15_35480 [Stieleria maiorica]